MRRAVVRVLRPEAGSDEALLCAVQSDRRSAEELAAEYLKAYGQICEEN